MLKAEVYASQTVSQTTGSTISIIHCYCSSIKLFQQIAWDIQSSLNNIGCLDISWAKITKIVHKKGLLKTIVK